MHALHARSDTAVLSVALDRQSRPDGGLRVRSPELPGLLLSCLDHERLKGGLASAIRWAARSKVQGEITEVVVFEDHAEIRYKVA